MVSALGSAAGVPPVPAVAPAPVQAPAATSGGASGGGGRQAAPRGETAAPPPASPAAQVAASSRSQADISALQPPGGDADPTAFRATEVVALAQLVLSRNFHGPVRTATAQELLFQARMALGKGESSLASDLANLASRIMAPQGHDGTGRHLGLRPEEMAAQTMQGGGAPAQELAFGPAPAAMVPLQGLAPLTLRERGVVLQAAPVRPRILAPRLATDGTPRGVPRT